jgi:hypothetical protein
MFIVRVQLILICDKHIYTIFIAKDYRIREKIYCSRPKFVQINQILTSETHSSGMRFEVRADILVKSEIFSFAWLRTLQKARISYYSTRCRNLLQKTGNSVT